MIALTYLGNKISADIGARLLQQTECRQANVRECGELPNASVLPKSESIIYGSYVNPSHLLEGEVCRLKENEIIHS